MMNDLVSRNIGIDVFRYIAFLGVVFVHTFSIQNNGLTLEAMVSSYMRFAVPFFFIASGYFLAKKDDKFLASTLRIFLRLAPVFIFWIIVYYAIFGSTENFNSLKKLFGIVLAGGDIAFHLWFLPALGVSMIAALSIKRLGCKAMLAIASIVYVLALTIGTYHAPLGLPDFGQKAQRGPQYGFLFVVIGYVIAHQNFQISMMRALLITILGYFLHITEAYILNLGWQESIGSFEFSFGIVIMGTGVFLVAKNITPFRFSKSLATLGKVSLGMYCVHILFVSLLKPIIGNVTNVDKLLLWLCVGGLSTITALVLSRVPLLKRTVS